MKDAVKVLLLGIVCAVAVILLNLDKFKSPVEHPDLPYKVYRVEIPSSSYETKINRIVRQLITNENASDFSKYKIIHDWVCDYVEYDYSGLSSNSWLGTLNDPKYVLETGLAVCGGYMRLYTDLCRAAGLTCDNLTGYGDGFNASTPHGWNRIKLDGKYYQVDTTWDDGDNSYGWFAVGYKRLLSEGRRYDGLLEVDDNDYVIDRDSLEKYEFSTSVKKSN